jgi:hypothetical protein
MSDYLDQLSYPYREFALLLYYFTAITFFGIAGFFILIVVGGLIGVYV